MAKPIVINPVVSDPVEIEKWKKIFDERKEELDKKVYNSVLEERTRLIKVITTKKIKANLDVVLKEWVDMSMQSFNPNLSFADVKNETFYLTNATKMNNAKCMYVRLYDEKAHKLVVEWFNQEAWYQKALEIKPCWTNKNYTMIKYMEIVKGDKGLGGFTQNRLRDAFIRREVITFRIQTLKLQKNLNLLSQHSLNNYDKMIDNLRRQIERPIF